MLCKPIIQIPGKSIRPPDDRQGIKCQNCGRLFEKPVKKKNPYTNKIVLVCPYCGTEINTG